MFSTEICSFFSYFHKHLSKTYLLLLTSSCTWCSLPVFREKLVYNSAFLQGKMKSIYDHIGMKAVESTVKSALDPTPKHECHVSKNANKVTSLLAYRAYELTQVVEGWVCVNLNKNLIKQKTKQKTTNNNQSTNW